MPQPQLEAHASQQNAQGAPRKEQQNASLLELDLASSLYRIL